MMFKDKVLPGGAKFAFRWIAEYKDGKCVDHTHETVTLPIWMAKSTPVRELPSGRRTIRIEE